MRELNSAARLAMREVWVSANHSHSLVFPLIPLFALRMLFRECVDRCFGTARRIGGRSSSSPASAPSDPSGVESHEGRRDGRGESREVSRKPARGRSATAMVL